MTEQNPNLPFVRHPTQKIKTVPIGTFKNTFSDEVMSELSIAVRVLAESDDKKLPASYKGENGEYPPGSSMWYTAVYNKYRNNSGVNGMNFPAPKERDNFGPCESSDACPFGVAKKNKDDGEDAKKPLLTVRLASCHPMSH